MPVSKTRKKAQATPRAFDPEAALAGALVQTAQQLTKNADDVKDFATKYPQTPNLLEAYQAYQVAALACLEAWELVQVSRGKLDQPKER